MICFAASGVTHSFCVIFTDEQHLLASVLALESQLSELIEPDFGLLEYLLRLGVLSPTQYDDVCSVRGPSYRRSEAVLELMKSEDQCDKLLQALRETEQQHIINFIIKNGGQHRSKNVFNVFSLF